MSEAIKLYTATVDGRNVAYSSETLFLVQLGRFKSRYRTRYAFIGNLEQAAFYYRGLNIGNGYKKRLVMPSAKKPIIARAFS